eukprot:CAMPEP_0171134806 /NCGR_PEP_ID=MMETSP0766_2-20121228/128659_1 /TAXON_ID=439317 /ORGANISM="Gambierdiscus australes, Strain CAWD 149" /LENGTH=220 /DNA_ID=CAMNT_0011598273 /DNA_START=30 /DNA_END=690 /DNA_ORIENTATION=+
MVSAGPVEPMLLPMPPASPAGLGAAVSAATPWQGVPRPSAPPLKGNTLVVRVRRASGLRNTDGPFAGKADPYVKLCLVDPRRRTVAGPRQTSVKANTLKPVWNEDITFEGIDTPAAYTLRLEVLDKDLLLGLSATLADSLVPDDKLGAAEVDLGTLYNSEGFQERELIIERRKLGLFKATSTLASALWGAGATCGHAQARAEQARQGSSSSAWMQHSGPH